MSKPLVAIVGRPNVGKSMLFNKLCGRRLSIVEDTPGVTRDRLYAECEWCGRTFDIVDTGGIEPSTDNEILLFMREQAQLAIDAADVVVLVTEIGTGVTAADQEVANMLLRSKKPVVLAVNKMDSTGAVDPGIYEFYSLGLGDPIAVSAVHGHGTGDLLDACLEHFPPEDASDADADYTRVAVIGKPNVGKSSLVNLILGEKRVIVSNVAGTTRDSVDSRFENKYGKYIFVDTAGIRRKSRVDDRIEKFSVMRAKLAIERADVCLIMIDARDGVTEQDTKIAGLAHEAGKASIIVVNKWDLVDKETGTMEVLFVSPVRPIRIILAKMIPYFVLSCLNLASILLLARYVLDVPMEGSLVGIVGISLLYLTLALALGLFISTVTDRQVTALIISAMLMLLPIIMLSGMVFPIENMPGILRGISCVVPARWYIDAIRKLMIEGLPFSAVLTNFLILLAMTVVLVGVALRKFNDKLE